MNGCHENPENNRKMKPLHTCYIKQKPSETQHLCGFRGTDGMKLGFTAFLNVRNNILDLRGILSGVSDQPPTARDANVSITKQAKPTKLQRAILAGILGEK